MPSDWTVSVLRSSKPELCTGYDVVFTKMYRMWPFKRDLALAGVPFLDDEG
jgi:hypothetical protein